MQVRARGPARGANSAHGVALCDRLPLAYIHAAEVGVHRFVAVAVLDEYHVAIAVLHASKLNHAVSDRAHGRARGRGEVGAQVGTPRLLDGVKAHGEAAGDARERHGRAEVSARHALAIGQVVGPLGLGRLLEPDGLVRLAVVAELRAEHAAAAQRLAVGLQRFVDDREAVFLAQRAAEVDAARKNVGQLRGHAVGNVGLVRGREQRAADHAARQAAAQLQRGGLDARSPCAVGAALDHQALEVAAVVMGPARGQADQAVVVGGLGFDLAVGAAQQLLARQAVRAQEGGRAGVGHAHALQQRLGGVAGAHQIRAVQRVAGHAVGQRGQGLALGQRGDGVLHGADRQVGRIGAERGHGECAAAPGEEEGGNSGGDAAGVLLGCAGDPFEQSLTGGGQAVGQSRSPGRGCTFRQSLRRAVGRGA